jgi:hypothetical protein
MPATLEMGFPPDTPLKEALEFLSDRYGLTILVDATAFSEAEDGGGSVEDAPVRLPKLTGIPLSTILRALLDQVKGTYVIRPGYIELTTMQRVRPEHKWIIGQYPPLPPVSTGQLPRPRLVYAVFEKRALEDALKELAEASDLSIVIDARMTDKAKLSVSATLNNVPVDTAVRVLADMIDLKMVILDNVLYVTSATNAAALQKEEKQRQADLRNEGAPPWSMLGGVGGLGVPASR